MSSPVASTHGKCPKCGHEECFTLFDDGNGFCHSECGGFVRLVETPGNQEEQHDVALVPIEHDYRNIPYKVWTDNGAQVLKQEGGDKPHAVAYRYPEQTKMRILPKDFTRNKGFKPIHPWGIDQYNAGSSKCLTITEGEDDRIAVIHMLKKGWPVIALPSATMSKEFLQGLKKWAAPYDSIAVCTDSDKAGDRAAVILETLFPNKCYRVNMTKYKDPMEYWENGAADDFVYAWINRKKFVKPFDTNTPDQFWQLYQEAVDDRYLPTGIEEYDSIGLGLFQGHFTVFTAPEGVGKTEFMRMLEYGLIRDHPDVPFAYCHLEETPQRSLLGLCSYALDRNVTRKDLITDEAEIRKSIDDMMGRENIHQFKIGLDEDPMVLVERIQYYANVCDCKYVFFEPLQDLAAQRQSDQTVVQFLDQMAIQLSRAASETGCGIVSIAHMNDDGNIRDSRQIGKQASVRVDLERDIDATNPEERNSTRLFIRKNRPASVTGYAGELMFDPDSFTLKEKYYAGD